MAESWRTITFLSGIYPVNTSESTTDWRAAVALDTRKRLGGLLRYCHGAA
jgi:hypothetical protein